MSAESTKVENRGSSEYVSQLLGLMAENVAGMGVAAKVNSRPLSGKKSSVIIDIVVGLGVAATWDVLKFVVGALGVSRRGSSDDEITINGRTYSIKEIDDGDKKDPDSSSD
ncbi:hypothetical protein ACIRG5_47460 [Lentzea sp. NPDC102401]|uniref:hypothetical protein n=1 Tax=Lentzea sp. NPDC102401 TaxID=3364128 RepID=UPI0038169864